MPQSPTYRTVDIEPLTGLLDTRSPAKEMAFGTWRKRQNFDISEDKKLKRSYGWRKFLGANANFNNHDYHDQLVGDPAGTTNLQIYYAERTPPYTPQSDIIAYPPDADHCGTTPLLRTTGRQPITFLFEVTSTTGIRTLLLGTQNRICSLSQSLGNWKIIADKYGGTPKTGLPERRWHAAQINDTVLFTNDFDPVLAWSIDQPTTGCDMQAVSEIADLQELNVTKAAVVWAWKGIPFLANIEMDGQRYESRILWGNLNKPLSYVPGVGSIAGYFDLTYGERILAGAPIGDTFLIYTNKGIWQITVVGGAQVFNFRSLYSEPVKGADCLAFRNTLASTGDNHIYAGRDAIYEFNPYMAKPERTEWIHKADNIMFDTLNTSVCEGHHAWYDPKAEKYFICWVEAGQSFPNQTLVLNLRYEGASTLDHGFTAFCNYTQDSRGSIIEWLQSACICTAEELPDVADILPPGVKEGGQCNAVVNPICTNRNMPIISNAQKDVGGKFVEDVDGEPATISLCQMLGDATMDDLCIECDSKQLFVAADSVDFCLKEFAPVFFRERCVSMLGCGQYFRDGYDSYLVPGPIDFAKASENKNCQLLELSATPEIQTAPSPLFCRVGFAGEAIDPRDAAGHCVIVWRDQKPKLLECQSAYDAATHALVGTRPSKPFQWAFWYTAKYFYFEFKITGIGGGATFSRVGMATRIMPSSFTA